MCMKNRIKLYYQLMRFDKPVGIYLLLWPTLLALWVAAGGVPPFHILIVFILGVVLMRSAGCIINDIADRHFDRRVERTKNRVLANGRVKLIEAIIIFILLILLAFVLVLTLDCFTILLSIVGVCLAALYPFTKRFTHLPQLFLGAAFAWSVPMAFAATLHQLPLVAWILYVAALILPIAYDTQYAMADREDDLRIGVKSTAILFGGFSQLVIAFLQAVFLGLMVWVGLLEDYGWIYYVGLLIGLGLFAYQQKLTFNHEPKACFKAFLNNQWVVLVVFFGAILGRI